MKHSLSRSKSLLQAVNEHRYCVWAKVKLWVFVALGFAALVLCAAVTSGMLLRHNKRVMEPTAHHFLAIGDWGRQGHYNQTACAAAMAAVAVTRRSEFVVSTGDNFYHDGLVNDTDPNFKESFTDVYSQKSLQVPWFAVLGNHDYHQNADAQLSPNLKAADSRWNCARAFRLKKGSTGGGAGEPMIELFFFDTNPWVQDYRDDVEKYNFSGIVADRSDPAQWVAYETGVLAELDAFLANSTARWRVVVGHHPVYSYSQKHGSQPELARVGARLALERNVLYLNGHDHNLQHIAPPAVGTARGEVHYVTTGAGSKVRGDIVDPKDGSLLFSHGSHGFVSVDVRPTSLSITHHDCITGADIFEVSLDH